MASTPTSDTRPYHHGDLRRALIEAALALVKEEQAWDFSLREVARRAGVSHNAPYNHFPEKRDLLAAVAALGFEMLRDRMLIATAGIEDSEKALLASGRAYVRLGTENPALYRLMFGPELGSGQTRPDETRAAGERAKAVLRDVVVRGAQSGDLAISSESKSELGMAALLIWSVVHGLTMLIIDKRTGFDLTVDHMAERVLRLMLEGLRPR